MKPVVFVRRLLVYNPEHRAAPADLAIHPYLCFVEETEAARYTGGSRPVGEMMEASSSSSTTMAAPVAGANSSSSKDATSAANGD